MRHLNCFGIQINVPKDRPIKFGTYLAGAVMLIGEKGYHFFSDNEKAPISTPIMSVLTNKEIREILWEDMPTKHWHEGSLTSNIGVFNL